MAGEDDALTRAFCARLPVELRGGTAGLAGELAALVSRARAEAPGVEVGAVAFAEYVADRVTFDDRGRPRLDALHAGDLWIACGCVARDDAALARFYTQFVPDIRAALGRAFDTALAEDAERRLLDKMLDADDGTARLAMYAGRGGLGPWLRAAAVRCAIDIMRARKELPVEPGALGELAGEVDPLLASLKQRYRDEFRVAFGEAAASLTDRERTLLRYRFLDDLSIDEIGALYRVHRATAARWIAAIREGLFERTRALLVARLEVSEGQLDSVLRLIDSQLDISIERVM